MCPGNDNQVDWTAAATPGGERGGAGLSGCTRAGRAAPDTLTRRGVMDTLLGESNLAAYDASGDDPYNTTGKSFRR
jgi:hypothetical protein